MGICDSVTSSSNSNSNKTNKQSKSKQYINSNTTASTNPKHSDNLYILSQSLAKRDDINKYYSLAPQYIGHGASGVVYEATDKEGKRYAIKRINKTSIKDIRTITHEAEISLLLSHEHIVKCYHIFEDLKTISIVLELIEGGDLFSFITTSPNGRLSDKDALTLITQILQTIKYLHMEMNITHRDIKPENFLVVIENNTKPEVKIKIKMIDFGFACYIPKEHFMNDNLGSPLYLAPEIVEGVHYNKNVDIWSAGVILYNMLTGGQPFSSTDRETTNDYILYRKINFKAIENEQLRELCQGMLERHPEFRLSAEKALKMAMAITVNNDNEEDDGGVDDNCNEEGKGRHNVKRPAILTKGCMKGVINLCNMNTYTSTLPDNIVLIH